MIKIKLFVGWRLFLVSLLLAIPFFGWSITRIVKSQQFDNNCSFYITDASRIVVNSVPGHGVEQARTETNMALEYLETHNLTSGYTSISDRASDEDLSLFYRDTKRESDSIQKLIDNPDDLKKLQEQISAHNLVPREISVPGGISIYPHNTLYMIWMFISILLVGLSVIGIITFINERSAVRR